jgi:hypothetical protein
VNRSLRSRAVFVLVLLFGGLLASGLVTLERQGVAASPPEAAAEKAADEEKGEEKDEDRGDEKEEEPKKEVKTHQTVAVGAYLNDIQTIDLKTHSYAVDLYLWFRWSSPDFDPATSFEFTNAAESWGHVREANWEEPKVLADGTRYQVVHAQGKFSRKFLLNNYPFDRQTIDVAFEDSVLDSKLLTYVADAEGFTINPTLVLPGFRADQPVMEIADRQYPTRFGDPDRSEPESYSRVTLKLPIQRPRGTYMIKLLLPVACSVLCAALMFLFKPAYVDARTTIGITALLTIVALQITLNADLPDVDYLVLMDKVYMCSYLFVIVGLLVVAYTTRMVGEDRAAFAARVDRWTLAVLLAVYTVATAALVVLAMTGE